MARRWLDDASSPRGRAERLLREGRALPAAEAAEAELARHPEDLAALCLAAIARLSAGEPAAAARHFDLALRAHPKSALAWALKGLLADGGKDASAARRSLGKAVRLSPREAFPWALRSQFFRAQGDLAACLKDLDAAVERGPEAWLHRLRAECHEKLGHMETAIADAEAAIRLSPRSPVLHELRGHCLFHRKDYEGAAASFSRGLSLAADHTGLLKRRADALWLSGDLAGAEADMRRCVELEPETLSHRLSLARLRVLGEGGAGVRAELERLAARGPEAAAGASFLKGVYFFRRGRFLRSADEFLKAEEAARAGIYPGRFLDAGYSVMAKGFQFMRRHRQRKTESGDSPVLVLMGLGLDYPYQATLEVLKELSRCDTVVNNLAGTEGMEFLSVFCRDVRTISFEGVHGDVWAEKIFGWLKPGRRLAFVTRGHPLVSGHLALELLQRARREGVIVRCLGAISSVDQVLALTQEVLGETYWGLQILDSQMLLSYKVRPGTGLPLLLYLSTSRAKAGHRQELRKLCGVLAAAYAKDHGVFVFGPRYDTRELREIPLGRLEAFLAGVEERMYSSHILFLPPAVNLGPVEARQGRESDGSL